MKQTPFQYVDPFTLKTTTTTAETTTTTKQEPVTPGLTLFILFCFSQISLWHKNETNGHAVNKAYLDDNAL